MKTRRAICVLTCTFTLVLTVSLWAKAAEPNVAPDHSLTAADYEQKGFPAIDKPWAPDQYEQAGNVLDEIAKSDATQLPRIHSATSGKVFDRIISDDNLPALNDPATKPEARLVIFEPLLKKSVRIFITYLNASKGDQTFDSEVLEVGAFLMRAERAAAILKDQMMKENAQNEKIVGGVKQIKRGLATTSAGLLQMMSDHDKVRASEALRFARELKIMLPQAYDAMLPEGKQRVRSALQQQIDVQTDTSVKDALQQILSAMPE